MKGILPILFLIFITLKLTGAVPDMSWWMVFTPVIAEVVIIAAVLVGFIAAYSWKR